MNIVLSELKESESEEDTKKKARTEIVEEVLAALNIEYFWRKRKEKGMCRSLDCTS